MSRRWQRPSAGFGRGNPRTQLLSMVMFLVILGLIYSRARDPQTWRWLADDRAAEPDLQQVAANANANAPAAKEPAAAEDAVVPGPTDEDAEEMADATRQFAAISDKAPLDKSEMPAYWRLMKWARGQSFKDLAARARRDVLYTQLWEQPQVYRGKLLKLRLHIKRVVEWEAPENAAGVKTVYEAWGWTDESKSYPYVVVFSELPPGMHVGADVQDEGVFVGYFLKIMTYEAFDKRRPAPLLVGRMQTLDRPGRPAAVSPGIDAVWYWTGGGALVLLLAVRSWLRWSRPRQPVAATQTAAGDLSVEDWLSQSPGGIAEKAPESADSDSG